MRVFIGSSSQAENKDLPAAVSLIEHAGLMPIPWTAPGTFPVGLSTWDALLKLLDEVDAAAFIFREDDVLVQQNGLAGLTRDNVILEFGLFSGKLGPGKCAIFLCGKPSIPGDLNGITYVPLDDLVRANAVVLEWADALTNSIKEPFRLNVVQITAIVQSMWSNGIAPNDISSLMELLHVSNGDVSRALRNELVL